MSVDFNNLLNDDGSNSVGTVMDKAEFQALLTGVVVTSTSTGAQNNWAPGLAGHTLVEWNGAADAAITGLSGGDRVAGQRVTIKNITTTKIITFAHQSGSSSAGNKFFNAVTSAVTPIAAAGWVTYQYDGTDWRLVAHEQGAWITPAYSGADYTASAGTWTVDSGDVLACAYHLRGRTLDVRFFVNSTSVSATPTRLSRVIPGGFTAVSATDATAIKINSGAYGTSTVEITGTAINFYMDPPQTGTWASSTNATQIRGLFAGIEVS